MCITYLHIVMQSWSPIRSAKMVFWVSFHTRCPCYPSSHIALNCFGIPQKIVKTIIKLFHHRVNIILTRVSIKFHGYNINYKGDMFLCCACCLCSHIATLLLIGMYVPGNPQLRLTIPLIHTCIINLHMPLLIFMAIGSKIKEISSFLCSLSLLPCSSIPAGWHACSHYSITPVTMSFNHNAFHIIAHIPEKFYGHRIKDEPYIILLVLAVPAAL